ncbi:NAD-dependent epimerase/dehydratase family protein [uncultured Paludibaculum sp.]|uniref:NAD-dependent epimerase/dehydratase family protein n=1 Tax=uncultured Paludibaculum sp. TaxID=1765020 RepID=UPI002AAB7343|nr:NAD-dependent epimerase/dehydratase family protein [uncultured Paludibaculum sp.]
MNSWQDSYAGRRVAVTGGLGFLGSNLAHALAWAGAEVTVLDALVRGCGGKRENLEGAARHCRVVQTDIGDPEETAGAVEDCDIVFNLAGEISHGRSMTEPERDGEINTAAQLRFLGLLAHMRPGIRVVYAGTRQVYGVPLSLPVDEDHPIDPVDFNGIHKYAATMYHMLYSRLGQLDAAVLRLSNVYGPRMALDVPGQGFLGVFLRQALLGEDLGVYQPGDQLRDPIFVDDAVDAFLAAGAVPTLPARSFNLGGGQALRLDEIATTIAQAAGTESRVCPLEFPQRAKAFDIGSYVADWSRARRLLDWRPRTDFATGVERTLAFYRDHWETYLPASGALCTVAQGQ